MIPFGKRGSDPNRNLLNFILEVIAEDIRQISVEVRSF